MVALAGVEGIHEAAGIAAGIHMVVVDLTAAAHTATAARNRTSLGLVTVHTKAGRARLTREGTTRILRPGITTGTGRAERRSR